MTTTPRPSRYNQYGMKEPATPALGDFANRPGGAQPGYGPPDAVDPSASRQGRTEPRPAHKPSSRAGQPLTGETDDLKR